jgi:hypothetical protein
LIDLKGWKISRGGWKMKFGILAGVIVIIAALLIAGYILLVPVTPAQPYHIHADFKVILNGTAFDFNKAQYMSEVRHELSANVHLHDFVPTVIHFHSPNATLGDFFQSLGMDFNSNCFFDGNISYCTNSIQKLRLYVNGTLNNQFGNYKPSDLDKILIYYGSSTPSVQDFNSIPSIACAYSLKCAAPPGINVSAETCESGNFCPA